MKKNDHHAEIDLFIGGFFSGFDSRHRRTPSVHTAEKTVIARSIGGQCGVPAFMKYLLMMFAFASSCASAEMFKCFDGVRPKYTYQNMPCEDSGLKTVKKITNKDATIGSADLSGYAKEARVREGINRNLEQDHQERRNVEVARSTVVSSRQSDLDECPRLILQKRGILSRQRYRSTQGLQDEYNWIVKRMQKIDCIGS